MHKFNKNSLRNSFKQWLLSSNSRIIIPNISCQTFRMKDRSRNWLDLLTNWYHSQYFPAQPTSCATSHRILTQQQQVGTLFQYWRSYRLLLFAAFILFHLISAHLRPLFLPVTHIFQRFERQNILNGRYILIFYLSLCNVMWHQLLLAAHLPLLWLQIKFHSKLNFIILF